MDRSRKNPEFMKRMKTVKEREKTYHDFPQSVTQQAKLLADAGFFYTGKSDEVTCAFCGGTVNEWEEDDIPLVEHKKHFPNCSFVKNMHVGSTDGETVADSSIPASMRSQGTTKEKPITANNGSNNSTAATPSTHKYKVEARDLRARMERPMVRKLQEMCGFDFEVMKRVMYEQLLTKGEDFERSEDFAIAIMDYQDKQKKSSADSGSTSAPAKCLTCKNREADTVFLPCQHKLFCHKCAMEPNFCQECGERIKGTTST